MRRVTAKSHISTGEFLNLLGEGFDWQHTSWILLGLFPACANKEQKETGLWAQNQKCWKQIRNSSSRYGPFWCGMPHIHPFMTINKIYHWLLHLLKKINVTCPRLWNPYFVATSWATSSPPSICTANSFVWSTAVVYNTQWNTQKKNIMRLSILIMCTIKQIQCEEFNVRLLNALYLYAIFANFWREFHFN